MTARYNAYFNGNESCKTGVVELEKLHKDDYSKMLSIYKLGTADNATSVGSYFDKAYTKASKVISHHSIFIKNKEYVRWVPEAYLLIGKSYYYKKEYKLAAEVFDYIIKTYKDYPTKYSAMVWLARTYNQQKKYDKAESMLDIAQDKIDKYKKQIPKQALKDFPMTYADYYLKQENNKQAIEFLLAAIDANKKKSVNSRLRFILAQVYQNMGNVDDASRLYDKVIKMNPSYEMAFNAAINKAICFNATAGNSQDIKKLLNKMARDPKNKEYLDQIYYALAEVCMKERDTTCAIDNYKLSAMKSVSNNNQKVTSYLKIAKLYFAKPEYKLAEMYYDSAMKVLPKDYPDYSKISALTVILKKLVTNLNVIEMQDSLQKLSRMTPAERNKIIDGIITEVIKEEQKKQEEAYQKQLSLNSSNNSNTNISNSSWYFYNSTTINLGKTEFIKKWGNRKLEDLWRLSNKTASGDFGTAETTEDSTLTVSQKKPTTSNLKDKNYYLKNIPVTADDIKKSNDLIADALYNAGMIYQNDLMDLPKAINTYEDFIKRFPDNKKYTQKVYYQLYLVYDVLNDETKKAYYKDLICSKDPDGDYCNIIKDPNYKKISTKNANIAVTMYAETFDAYKAGRWDSVLAKSNRAILMFSSDTILVPKFTYLKALAYGKNKDSLNLVKTLQLIIDKYPKSPLKPMAKDLLDFRTGKVTTTALAGSATAKGYSYDETAIHLYTMVVNVSKNFKISDLKNLLSDFNTKNFSNDNLTISNIFIDNTRQMITISNFQNKEKAMLYFTLLKNDKNVFAKLTSSDYVHFIISVDNYPIMFKSKDIDNYYLFFQKNYLK
jgi:tetratricopeptide (TPR) repeat protein